MRTVSAGMAAHLAGDDHYRVWMLRLDLEDGTFIALTSNSDDVPFDLDDGEGEFTYLAGTGIDISDVEQVLGLAPSNYEVKGPIAEVVTLDGLLGGRFNNAVARLFQANPEHPDYGAIPVQLGFVTDNKPDADRFTLEISSETAKLNQPIGRTVSPQCDADFGDERCGVVPETITATVTGVTDDLEFSVAGGFAGAYADNYFNYGKVQFTSGNLAGTRPIQIFLWTAAGDVTMLVHAAEAPQVGDELTISRGCSKIRKSDDPTIPTCLTYNNVDRFRGFPDCVGSDQALRAPIPGNGDQ